MSFQNPSCLVTPNTWNNLSKSFLSSANLVLHRTIERIHVGKKYGDIPRGIFVVRGENVVLLGEIVSWISLSSFLLLLDIYLQVNQ